MYNKKGLTLVELLLSIVLVGIIVIFLFQLLSDLKGESENTNYALANQVNHIEIVNTVETDLIHNSLYDIVFEEASEPTITFKFWKSNNPEPVSAVLKAEYISDIKKYYVTYTDVNNVTSSWEIKDGILDPCASITYYNDNTTHSIYFHFNIFVYNAIDNSRNNKYSNNPVDDIEINYVGTNYSLRKDNNGNILGFFSGFGTNSQPKQMKNCNY